MPNTEVTTPAINAPVDRLSLTVTWSTPTATGIDSVTPSFPGNLCFTSMCFADEA